MEPREKVKITSRLKCAVPIVAGAAMLLLVLALRSGTPVRADQRDEGDDEASRIQRGFDVAPVPLDLTGKNRALVGLGSYIVNTHAQCADCHTWPQFVQDGNPFLGQPEQANTAGYLAGGRPFLGGTVFSRNLTPDPNSGLPADLTFAEFERIMRTGIDDDELTPHIPSADNDLLQVMPWPWFQKMTRRDLLAIYEYLRAIPSVP
jgi:hypothetical protein